MRVTAGDDHVLVTRAADEGLDHVADVVGAQYEALIGRLGARHEQFYRTVSKR